jgi:hypothetical protein
MLQPGDYVLHESDAPAGYSVAEDIAFRVTGSGTVVYGDATSEVVVMTDRKVPQDASSDVGENRNVGNDVADMDTKDDRADGRTVQTSPALHESAGAEGTRLRSNASNLVQTGDDVCVASSVVGGMAVLVMATIGVLRRRRGLS